MADKMPPAPPVDDEDTDQPAAPGADDIGGDDQSGQVLCTVLKNADGGYTLLAGDEDEGTEGGASPTEVGGDMGGAPDMSAEKPEGQTFSEPGQLLKGILDLLNKDAEASGGSAQDHFQAGYSGDSAPTPKKAPPKF